MAANWDNYGSVAKRAIAVAFSGVRQQERFLVLMENYGDSLKYAEIASNSAGTATEKYGAYLDGVEAHVNSLKAAFESFSVSLLDSDFLNGIIDIGSVLLNVLNVIIGNNFVKQIGLLNIALATTVAIIGSKKFISSPISAFFTGIFGKLGPITKKTQAFSGALTGLLITVAAIGAVKLFNALDVTLEEQQQKLADINEQYTAVTSEIEALNEKKFSSPLDVPLTANETKRLEYLTKYSEILQANLAEQRRATLETELFGSLSTGFSTDSLKDSYFSIGPWKFDDESKVNRVLDLVASGRADKNRAYIDDVYGSILSKTTSLYAEQAKLEEALSNPDISPSSELYSRIEERLGVINDKTEKYQGFLDAIIETGYVSYQEDVAEAIQESASEANKLSKSFAEFQTEVSDVVTKSSALSSALQQQATDGYLSAESLAALAEAGVKYSASIDESSGKYSINTEKIQETLSANISLERSLLKLREATDLKMLAELEATDASKTEIENIKLQLAQYAALDEQLMSLISSMGDYKVAVETANASSDFDYATGDMLGTITSGLESGRVATDEFKAAMAYFTDGSLGDEFTQDSIPAIKSFFDEISKYTQGGAAGLNAATEAFSGLLDANGQFIEGTTLEMAANALGENVGTEFAYSLLKSYEDYGFDLNLEDIMRPEDWEAVTTGITKTADGFLSSYDKLLGIQDQIQQARYYGDEEGLQRLTDQSRNLAASLSSSEITASINNLQTLLDSGEYSGTSAEAIQKQIDSLNNLLAFKTEMDAIPIEVKDNASAAIAAVSSALSGLDGRRATAYIDVITRNGGAGNPLADSVDTVAKGGLGRASGNANAGGSWGSGSGGKTLMGELGRELVVNPHTNRWYTVGDRGAQFVNLPQNAIVFNHIQTEGILGNGSIFGRGRAMVSGNAAISVGADLDGRGRLRLSGGIAPIDTGDDKPKDRSKAKSEKVELGELYKKEIKLLEHQAKLIGDMLNLYAEGSDAWFTQQQNIIDTYKKSAELTEAEYWRLHDLSKGVITDDMQKLMEDLINYKKEVFDASKEYWESERDNANSTLEYLKSQAQAVIDLKTSYHDLSKSIQAEQREIDNQLKIAADAYPNLTEAERAAVFSGDDYQELSRRLAAISAEANDMYTDYLDQIKSVGEDASYELKTITDEFERQYDLKLDQYNLAKAELGVLKARKNLENVKNERSVAMLIGGLWTWVADSDKVISAMNDLSSAEQDLSDAQSDASFNADKANWEGYISSIDNQIGAIDALVFSMDDLATEVHSLVDGVQQQIQLALSANTVSLLSALPSYSGTSTSLFNTTSLQNLWVASITDAISAAGASISTSDLIGELLSNMASYGSSGGVNTTGGDVLVWNGNVVASGDEVTTLIRILRSLVPLTPMDN